MSPALIQSLIAPVVMISAGGMIYRGLNSHLSRILARVRLFHAETLSMVQLARDSQGTIPPDIIFRFEGLSKQGDNLLKQAYLVKKGMICILVSILFMLLTSLAIGVAFVFARFDFLPIIFFVSGLLLMMLAVVLTLIAIKNSLVEVEFEHSRIYSLKLE